MYAGVLPQGYPVHSKATDVSMEASSSQMDDHASHKRGRGADQRAQPAGSSPSGSSLSTDSECLVDANEHSSNMAQSSQAPAPLECNESSTVFGVHMPDGGWFAKCRGCGWMTAHEHEIQSHQVPFCKRCQATYDRAAPVMRARMTDTLVYVHTAWLTAGL